MTAAVEGALSRIMTKSGVSDDRNIVISHRHLKSQIQWISKTMTARGKQSERHACSVMVACKTDGLAVIWAAQSSVNEAQGHVGTLKY